MGGRGDLRGGAFRLNDDRLGRALDAIAPHLEGIVGSIGAVAIGEFGLDVSRLHWDMTSISMHRDYDRLEKLGSRSPATSTRRTVGST